MALSKSELDLKAEKARDAGVKVRHMIDAATGEISEVAEKMETRINAKPVPATLVALATGLFLGLLLRRR